MTYYPFAPENDASYRLALGNNVATFNDALDPDFVGIIEEITGLDGAEVRESAEDLAQSDGGMHGDFYLGRRPIVISGRSYGHATVAQRNARLDKLKRASNALRTDATLSWRPRERRENWVLNPKVEVNLAGLNAPVGGGAATGTARIPAGGTITRDTGIVGFGAASAKMVTSAAMNNGTGFSAAGPLKAGVSYTVSFSARGGAGGESLNFYVNDAAGTLPYYGANNGSTASGPNTVGTAIMTTAWQRITFTFTPNEDQPNPVIAVRSGTASIKTFYVDGVVLSPTALAPGTFSDGSIAGWFWSGTPNASPSSDYVEMFVPVRLQQPTRLTGGWVKMFQVSLVSEYSQLFSMGLQSKSALAGSTNGATQHVLENRGSGQAFPIIRIYGNGGQNPYVENMTTGEIVRTNLTLSGGQWLEIDTLNHTAKRENGLAANGSINYPQSTVTWPSLVMGNNTLRLVNGGSMDVTYRDSWA